ncbi:MAG: helix-turn-helix transcriptional regulator [Flavobacteriales bacterium]
MNNQHKKLEKAFGAIKQSPWTKAAAEWKANLHWIENSQKIALEILEILDQRNMSQKALASELNVSAQQVSKWLTGKENFTLETISNFEKALKVKIIEVLDSSNNKVSKSTSILTIKESYNFRSAKRKSSIKVKKEAKIIPLNLHILRKYKDANAL